MRVPILLRASVSAVVWLSMPLALQGASSSGAGAASGPVLLPSSPPPIQAWWQNGGPRLRPIDGRTARLIEVGLARSAVVRDLVGRIDRGDAIVYVGLSPTVGREGLAGRLSFAGQGGDYRYLRVWLNPALPADQAIAALAHELRHVVEVLDDDQVRSESALSALYRRIGHQTRTGRTTGWETDAALRAGADVRRELASGTATAVAGRTVAATQD